MSSWNDHLDFNQLLTENELLRNDLAEMTAERDAAVERAEAAERDLGLERVYRDAAQQDAFRWNAQLGDVAAERDRLALRLEHQFNFSLDGIAPRPAWIGGKDVDAWWIRATCSCGWHADDDHRYTLEMNAWWEWSQHVKEALGEID